MTVNSEAPLGLDGGSGPGTEDGGGANEISNIHSPVRPVRSTTRRSVSVVRTFVNVDSGRPPSCTRPTLTRAADHAIWCVRASGRRAAFGRLVGRFLNCQAVGR